MRLTEKQERFLNYLRDYVSREGQAPSLRGAAADLGVSHTAVAQLLAQLEKKGVVEREGRYSRSIRLRSPAADRAKRAAGRELPIVGQVTAGMPMYAQQEWDGSVIVDGRLFRGDNLFCLRIKGDSMRDAGILERLDRGLYRLAELARWQKHLGIPGWQIRHVAPADET